MEKKIGNGLISIKGYLRENTVYIEIIDNGVGFDPNFISSSLIYNDTEQTHIHSNIGIINTMKRIKLLYGNEFGIKIESRLNYGTKAVIHIPVDIGDNKNGNPAKDV